MGIDYIRLRCGLSDCGNIDYHVVESAAICEEGRSLFESDLRISFHSSLPQRTLGADIVYINSALQYMSDYGSILNELCAYKPKYFLFVRLSAGEVPTYFTLQKNVSGVNSAYQFVNIYEFTELMSVNGYKLIFKGRGDVMYDQNNFPQTHRLGYTCNLAFIRA